MENKFCFAYVISLMVFIAGASLMNFVEGATTIAFLAVILMAMGVVCAFTTYKIAEDEGY